MKTLFLVFLQLLAYSNGNTPDVDICNSNVTDTYVANIKLNIVSFPIILPVGETNGILEYIHGSIDILKEIPIGSTVQIGLVKQGLFPTPLPCFPVNIYRSWFKSFSKQYYKHRIKRC